MATRNKAGVVGFPATHSLSPRIHGYWLKKYGITGSYEAYEIPEPELEAFISSMPDQGFAGVNITIPYKETVLPWLDFCDEAASFVQAVNTITVDNEGKRYGRNTDIYGFVGYLQHCLEDKDALQGKKVVVLGAGGAARAIVAGLIGELAVEELVLLNRTREKAEQLKQSFIHSTNNILVCQGDTESVKEKAEAFIERIHVEDWEKRSDVLEGASCLVNTTSLGMVNQPELEISLDNLPAGAIVSDIVFNPLKTALLAQAEAKGYQAVDGLGMLLHQAAPGFKAWFDPEDTIIDGLPEVDEALWDHVIKGLPS